MAELPDLPLTEAQRDELAELHRQAEGTPASEPGPVVAAFWEQRVGDEMAVGCGMLGAAVSYLRAIGVSRERIHGIAEEVLILLDRQNN